MIYLISESEQLYVGLSDFGVTLWLCGRRFSSPLWMFSSQAVSRGWRKALPVAFSPLVTDGPVAILVLALLSQASGWCTCPCKSWAEH